eukprot:Nitzschia sp. Nitz4//scaffold283_size24287//11589//12736//NITZ4_008404-RA/size24287-snap-gene-0.16-mRNA-1//-1//CDS//3329545651//5013//frame0
MSTQHRQKSSLYPLHPPGSGVLVRHNPGDLTTFDLMYIYFVSSAILTSVAWVPALFVWAWRKIRSIPKEKRRKRALYAGILAAMAVLFVAGPHRNKRFGEWSKFHKWKLWTAFYRYFAFEVVADGGHDSVKDLMDKQAIIAVSPHGLFPFGLAFAVFSEAFGRARIVVASATQLVPFLRDILRYVHSVDASRPAVDRALSDGHRLALAPGGIAEMFEGYPKAGTHPDDEVALIRKGIFRMAVKHGVPILPVYCFGSSKLMRRLQLPSIVEKISLLLRMSIVILYGRGFLPIPFRQKLLYVVGRPVNPLTTLPNADFDARVDELFAKYCAELIRIFDRQKESYGWAHKSLRIIER